MNEQQVIAVDLGGTNIRVARIDRERILSQQSAAVRSEAPPGDVIGQIFGLIDNLGYEGTSGIGIGVPGPVDEEQGIVYELINIPSWKEEPVGSIFEERYGLPVKVQNDANCFALAEKIFGKGRECRSFIGLIVGTGMAGGIILDHQLYSGPNGMAGEFGMMGYLDKYYEHYSSGQFFEHKFGISAREAAERADQGDKKALDMWETFGHHLGKAIESILYAYDPEKIILGGSLSRAFRLYEKAVWKVLEGFAFRKSISRFQLESSTLEEPGLLGAAALHFIQND